MNLHKKRLIISLCLCLFILSRPLTYSQEKFLSFVSKELDSIIEAEMKRWKVPGLSLGILYNDKVIFNKGYGYNGSQRIPVTENTGFMIGSLTKAMTCSALFIAEEKGLLSVKDSIKTHLPSINLGGYSHSNSLILEDFFSGRTGLPAHWGDFFYWKTKKNRTEVIDVINGCNDVNRLRDKFNYNNLAYIALGNILEKVSGQSWEDFLTENIFNNLRMNNTYPNIDLAPQESMANPHYLSDRKLMELKAEDIQNMGPAGSVVSTSTDMLKWIKGFLHHEQKESILSLNVIKKMKRPYTFIGYRRNKENKFQNRFMMYGAGWSISDYNDVISYRHNGGTDGFLSELLILPELSFGIIVLSNSRSHQLTSALVNLLEEKIYGLHDSNKIDEYYHDFSQENSELFDTFNQNYALLEKDGFLKLGLVEGKFINKNYGAIDISIDCNKVNAIFNNHREEKKGILWSNKETELRCIFNENFEDFYDMEIINRNNVWTLNIKDGENIYVFQQSEDED